MTSREPPTRPDHTLGDGRLRTATSYDPAGRPTSTTDFRDGDRIRSEHTTYDQLDNPVRVIGRNADWSVHTDVEVGYDPLGRETSETIHTGKESLVTLINRDEAGLVLSEVDPRGTATGADPAQFTTSYTYDGIGRQVTATAPPVEVESGGQQPTTATPVTTTGYDAAGRVTSTTDALNQTTTYGYDELGNQRRRTDPPALYGQAGVAAWAEQAEAVNAGQVQRDRHCPPCPARAGVGSCAVGMVSAGVQGDIHHRRRRLRPRAAPAAVGATGVVAGCVS
ncbi:YD repeat-containing protein [Saccharomonospora amisosensis]|uniref:YD repeat-containing protein n=1 Tax=Saccharomonospora amisosensis TaxID=1128677 RepID=A0A7X5ZQJ3_9PSEU|nr:RHS repeat domain-containing protein [Saccharomonospora amisosensis]NIJ11904.1 YD repeat-containing protein [Saccharomonospora amisosensis]